MTVNNEPSVHLLIVVTIDANFICSRWLIQSKD